MKQSSVIWLGYLFSFLLVSCAGTEIIHKQVNEAYKGKPFSNILVIAITGVEDSRRSFERKFVAQLKSAGVKAVSSEAAIPMPADLELKKEAILKAIRQFGNDAVIITRLIDREVKEDYTRGGYASSYHGYYGYYSHYVHGPAYSSLSLTVQLETNLYDVKTEKLIWSGQSKTMSRDSKSQIIDEVIKVVINELQHDKVIRSE